ncbi:MAG: class I SAM-dependent methyltransferase [Planctomycetes bacterium]|nr:class I SAM-dependent methyltransferase [Planctomycetota bacterium]
MPSRLASLAAELAEPVPGVAAEIAPGDMMLHGDPAHYAVAGQSAWRCIATGLLAAGVADPKRVLDLPCGHGRVTRVLRRALPDAELTVCDLDRDGVDHCASAFGATPVYSREDLAEVGFDEAFDLIWCGSLVTHLDKPGWLATFQLVMRSLRPQGVAVITFHGRWSAYRMQTGKNYGLPRARVEQILASYAATGFGYADYENGTGYGVSLNSPAWLIGEVQAWQELRIVALCERQWDDHQDVLVVQAMG